MGTDFEGRHMRSYSSLFLMVFFAVACNTGDETMDAAAEAPVADAAVSSDLSCLVMGDIVALEGRASPLQEVRFEYEGGEGLLCYGAPSARDREIMGGLVPFGAPWRGGANEPTTVHLSAATTLGGIPLEAGSYSLYAIPGESEWEFFVNSNFERWGVPINDDVRSTELGSFAVNVGATEEMVETLVYEHMEGHFMLSWDNAHIHIPFGN